MKVRFTDVLLFVLFFLLGPIVLGSALYDSMVATLVRLGGGYDAWCRVAVQGIIAVAWMPAMFYFFERHSRLALQAKFLGPVLIGMAFLAYSLLVSKTPAPFIGGLAISSVVAYLGIDRSS